MWNFNPCSALILLCFVVINLNSTAGINKIIVKLNCFLKCSKTVTCNLIIISNEVNLRP